MMKLYKIQVLLFCILTSSLFGQDVHFSQFYMSPLTQNPSMAGAVHDLQAIANYKNQWASIGAAFKTFAASYDMKLFQKNSKTGYWAGGFNFFSDKAGDSKMGITQANLTAAYHVYLNEKNTLGAGIQGGFSQRSIDYSALQWGNQYDYKLSAYNPSISPEPDKSTSFGYADFGTGLVWVYDKNSGSNAVADNNNIKANVGLAVFHVNRPKYSFNNSSEEKLNMKFVLHGNAAFSISNSNFAIIPGFVYYKQGGTHELYAGALIRNQLKQASKFTGIEKSAALSIGAYLRANDALVPTMLLEYSYYALGLSYDVNISKLKAATGMRGGFEISLRYVRPDPLVIRTKTRY